MASRKKDKENVSEPPPNRAIEAPEIAQELAGKASRGGGGT